MIVGGFLVVSRLDLWLTVIFTFILILFSRMGWLVVNALTNSLRGFPFINKTLLFFYKKPY